MITLKTLANIFKYNFGEPFLPTNHVQVRLLKRKGVKRGEILKLKIGRRDVDIDSMGRVVGSGTDITTERT